MRILIVDAMSHTREHLRTFLELQEGLEVIGEASSGAEALRLSQALSPDIVIIDINLPDMNGLDVTRQVTASAPHQSVILLTLHSEDLLLQDAIAVGAQACVGKSAGVQSLLEAVCAQSKKHEQDK